MPKTFPLLALLAADAPPAAQSSGNHTVGSPDGYNTPAPQHQYSAEGYYTVSPTAENACRKATYVKQIYVFLPEVAVSASTEAAFQVYPDPISGRFWGELETLPAGAVGELHQQLRPDAAVPASGRSEHHRTGRRKFAGRQLPADALLRRSPA